MTVKELIGILSAVNSDCEIEFSGILHDGSSNPSVNFVFPVSGNSVGKVIIRTSLGDCRFCQEYDRGYDNAMAEKQ